MENTIEAESIHNEIKNRKDINANLDNVKSLYILKDIFSFLCKKSKYKMIIYNNKYKKRFQINIEDYKKLSGKYVIRERNGKGKEYTLDTKLFIFSGYYSNGIKNGKGEEYYDDGKLKFEGEYSKGIIINGKGYNKNKNIIMTIEKNGKGKEIYNNEKIKFEGEYFNGKRWNGKLYDYKGKEEFEIKHGKGKIKEYNYFGELIFEGEYSNGERNGKGLEYKYGKLMYEGEYLNNQRNGKGKEYDKSREFDLIFEGEYLNGERWNGKLKEFYKKDRFRFVIRLINDGRYNKNRKDIKKLICDYFNKNVNMKGIEKNHSIFLISEYEYACGNIIKYKIL